MKKHLLLLGFLCLLFAPGTEAQPYPSIFGTDSTKWLFRWSNLNVVADEYYFHQKDTLVNDTLYRKITTVWMPENLLYTALFREDTVTGKVWTRPLYSISVFDTIEYLAFDFGLNVGDTFNVGSDETNYVSVYKVVDSVKYINGLKYIYLDHFIHYAGDPGPWEFPTVPTEPFTLIEGIGSNAGPLWKTYSGELRNQYLMCSYKNGVQTSYKNLRYDGLCPQLGNAINEQDINKAPAIKIYPNPASDYIIIDEAYLGTLKSAGIYDLSGKMLRKITGPGKTDISRIPAGLYLVKMTTKGQVTYTKKLTIYR